MNNPKLQPQIDTRCPCFEMPQSECTCTEIPQENVVCPRCFQLHSDIDEWALKPHKTHLCQHCGNLFEGTYKAVSHPAFTSGFPDNVKFVYPPILTMPTPSHQKSDYDQMVEAINTANYWLQRAYNLMESQGITEQTVDSNWPIDLGDAVHYCGEAVDKLEPS